MHSTDTKSRFIELRAKGWSLARIAAHLEVAQRTLVDWNQHSQTEIRAFKAVELEALQEKLIASHEAELTQLTAHLRRIEQELAGRDLQIVSTENLYRLASSCAGRSRKPGSIPTCPAKPGFPRRPPLNLVSPHEPVSRNRASAKNESNPELHHGETLLWPWLSLERAFAPVAGLRTRFQKTAPFLHHFCTKKRESFATAMLSFNRLQQLSTRVVQLLGVRVLGPTQYQAGGCSVRTVADDN